ncbi:MAG: autotransporter outer membrane beta-barrel domain-containing protein, partial [Puniceicoccales bacterium]|nr:autotransporter outer membrane beta-barrel domain-containing protein [Puniceicoccales bacterium]
NFLAGVAAESSLDDYDVEQSLGGGGGKVRHHGANFFAKQRFASGTDLALIVRGGRGKVRDDSGTDCCRSYDGQSSYHGVQGSFGRQFRISAEESLEGYGKFSWTRRTRSDLPTAGGAELHVDAVNSLRGQLGLRYCSELKVDGNIFCGIGFEHEFDGRIGGTIGATALPKVGDDRRNCGFAEVGVDRKISGRWVLSGGIRATAGARDGWSGGLRIGAAF